MREVGDEAGADDCHPGVATGHPRRGDHLMIAPPARGLSPRRRSACGASA
jgi:hypothetical protein